jgi:hypothetical protein
MDYIKTLKNRMITGLVDYSVEMYNVHSDVCNLLLQQTFCPLQKQIRSSRFPFFTQLHAW